MTHKPHRPGTRAHTAATYNAMCAYQEGASIEAAARAHNINAETLRRRLHAAGFLVHTRGRKHAPKRSTSSRRDVVIRMHLDDGASLREIAAETSMSYHTVRGILIDTGTYVPKPVGATTRAAWSNSLKHRTKILQCVELRSRGLTHGQIAIRLDTPRSTIGTWLTKYHNHGYLWQQYKIPDWWSNAS